MEAQMEKYIKTHWNGEFPLWKSYWLNSVILSSVAAAIAGFLLGFFVALSAHIAEVDLPPQFNNKLGLLVAIPIVIWSLVGTWRSASVYNDARPTLLLTWGSLAKIGIVFGWFSVMGQVVVLFK